MAKVVFVFLTALVASWGETQPPERSMQKACLACHVQQQIPSEMIYRRYLMKYSSKARIREQIFTYLKAPSAQSSIMPAQFFKKYPLKEPSKHDDETLQSLIDAYIDHYDVRKKLYVVPEKER